MRHSSTALVSLLWAAIASAHVSSGPPFVNAGPPLLLRLEGILAQDAARARAQGFTVASLGVLGRPADQRRWLGVTDARTVGGDQAVDGKDVLNAVSPFTPNLLVAGPPAVVERLLAQPDGAHVVIEGLVDRASRTYYLRSIETAPASP